MRTLLILAGLFFSIFGAFVGYFAASDPGNEYDLKFVLPIDTRQMPKPSLPPQVMSQRPSESEASDRATEGRAGTGISLAAPEK